MMLTLLFMFQFSLVIKEHGNQYDINEYYTDNSGTSETVWKEKIIDFKTTFPESDEYTLLIGSKSGKVGKIAMEWCTYTKRELAVLRSLEDYSKDLENVPELILVDSEYLDIKKDVKVLKALAEDGVNIVFCDIPIASDIKKSVELQELLGITEVVEEDIEVESIRLFPGLLLGGEVIYEADKDDSKGMDYIMPWYMLDSGTKTYMMGVFESDYIIENELKNEDLPAIIWRNSVGEGKVFVVNGDYLHDSTGLGFLNGFMLEINPVDIYPVINAQNLSVANYPGFASENDEEMQKIYSRTQRNMFRDTIWPSLVSTTQNSNMKLTCFSTPQYKYTDANEPDGEELVFYLKQFKEVGAEAGLSLVYGDGISLKEKIERDNVFYSSLISNYKYGAVYIDNDNIQSFLKMSDNTMLKDVSTIVCTENDSLPMVSYCADDITVQRVTNDGFSHTYTENLRMRSLESALGYTNVVLDMNRVVWPENDTDHWHVISKTFSSNIETYWSKFKMFDSTTLSESNERVRSFLAMDYDKSYKDGVLTVNITNQSGKNWFILRTHGETISEISGATYKKIEDNAFLIEAKSPTIEIELKKEDEFLYTLP